MSVINQIRSDFGRGEKGCREPGQGRRLRIGRVSDHYIIKPAPGLGERACDCIIFVETADELIIVVVDLKGYNPDLTHAADQVRNCFRRTQETMRKYDCHGKKVHYILAVVADGYRSVELKSFRETIDGYTLRTYKYKQTLRDIIAKTATQKLTRGRN